MKREWRIKYERAVNTFTVICRLLTFVSSTPYGVQSLSHAEFHPLLAMLLHLPWKQVKLSASRLLCAISLEKPVAVDLMLDCPDFTSYARDLEEKTVIG